LTNVDLADVVTIGQTEVEVYDEDRYKKEGSDYPRVGEKLNRSALVTFYAVDPRKDTVEKKREFLERAAKSMNVSLLQSN